MKVWRLYNKHLIQQQLNKGYIVYVCHIMGVGNLLGRIIFRVVKPCVIIGTEGQFCNKSCTNVEPHKK